MAFHPALLPFPLLHVDTTWKFREMPAFHDRRAQELGCGLIVHINDDGIRKGIDTFVSRSRVHIDVMKTQAPNRYGFDAAFGGTRWDKKKPHTKDGILSLRSSEHRCDPKNQRQAPWTPFDAPKQKRIFVPSHFRIGPSGMSGTTSVRMISALFY